MAEPSPAGAPAAPAPKLDELMLAMDVVDTLRHQEGLVAKELGQGQRDETLKDRLRKLYEGQGLTVSDAILEEGIRALKESRFTYTPPPSGPGVLLARIWVRRGYYVRLAAVAAIVVAAAVGWQSWSQSSREQATEAARVEIEETLPKAVDAAVAAVAAEARDSAAKAAVEALAADARSALARGDAAATRTAVGALEALRGRLVEVYELRIVSRPGEPSGVYRIPDVNEGARNYYLIVEAVTPSGELVALPVKSEEDGRTATVSKWGVRVPRATFEAVVADKQEDGIVSDAVLAEKPRGSLDPVYLMRVEGGAITSW